MDRSDNSPPPRPRFSRWSRPIRVPVITYLVIVILMVFSENSLIYFPSVYPDGDWNPHGLKFEDAWFDVPDGTQLHGWYVPASHPRAIVLFAHGNGGNLSHRFELLKVFSNQLQTSVMIFDYRGYGRSAGKPTEAGILSDGRAARAWLAARTGAGESEIVLMGESLGGAVMVDLAAQDVARGLILENTFTSLPEVAAYHYPWLPVKLFMRTQLNSVAKIDRFRGPLLQLHGEADTIIPLDLGQRLFAAANEPKQFVVIPGGDHNDPRSPQAYAAIDQFLSVSSKSE